MWVEYEANTIDNYPKHQQDTRTERVAARRAAVHHVHRAFAAERAGRAAPEAEEAHDSSRNPRARTNLRTLTFIGNDLNIHYLGKDTT